MIHSGQAAIGTTPTIVDGISTNPIRLTIQNLDNTDTVFIGGPNVTINNGLGILKLETLQLDLAPLDQVFAVSGKAGHIISWLRQDV